MKTRLVFLSLALLASSLNSLSCKRGQADNDEVAVLETNYGRVVIQLLPEVAPKQVANFRDLVQEGFYDGTKIHRLVKNKNVTVAVQGGDPNTISGDPSTWGKGLPGLKKMPAEFSKALRHVKGTVSAARPANDENGATSQFFICVAPTSEFDGKYTIFGRVLTGMNIVEEIGHAPTFQKTERPVDPVVVDKIYLARRADLK